MTNTFHIRRLLPEDMSAYCDHMLGLDRHSRNDRFEGAMSDGAIIKYATRPLKEGEYLYGAFDGDHLCGVGELRSSASTGGETHAEAALSVERAHRKQGIGARLFERLRFADGRPRHRRHRSYRSAKQHRRESNREKIQDASRL